MEIIIEKIKTYEKGKNAGFEYIFHYKGKHYTRRKSYIMQDGKFKFLFKIKERYSNHT